MPIQEFNPVFRPVTNPVDLDKLGQAYDTLEKGHLQTIDTASAVAGELAKLDLNEKEDAWRQEQVNKIRSAVTDNTQYGNAYGALDDVIRANGAIMSDPGMIGRLRAQQDYKQYIDKLDKRTDIPEDYKNYYKEINKYDYKDIKDDKGNIIGGSKWQPYDQEVSTVPMDQVLSKALQWAAKESGGGSQTRWLDANGKVTDDITKSVTGEFYSSSSNRWERLSKEKLAAAVSAVIENTPGAKASLEQDYKIAKWKYDKSGGNNPDIVDKNGMLLTPEQYLAKKIDPFYKAATYYNQTSDTKYGEAWKAQLALVRAQQGAGQATNQTTARPDLLGVRTNKATIVNDEPVRAQASVTSAKQQLSNILGKYNPDGNYNLDGMDVNAMKDLIKNNVTDATDKMNALIQIDAIEQNQEYLNEIKKGANPDDQEAFDAYNAITSMSDLPKGNKYAERFTTAINQMYSTNGTAVRQYMTDDIYDNFIKSIGGVEKAKALGINFNSKDGVKYAELPRDNSKAVPAFMKAFGDAKETQGYFANAWDNTKRSFGGGTNVLTRVDSSGNEVRLTNRRNKPGEIIEDNMWNAVRGRSWHPDDLLYGADTYDVYQSMNSFVNSLERKFDNVIKTKNVEIEQMTLDSATPNAAEALMKYRANPASVEATKYASQFKLEDELAKQNIINNLDLTQTGGMIINEDNISTPLSNTEAKEVTAMLRTAKPADVNVNLIWDYNNNSWAQNITIRGSDTANKEREPITFTAPAVDSATVQAWNRNTTFRAKSDVNKYKAFNRDLYVGNETSFSGIDKMALKPTAQGYVLVDKTNNNNTIRPVNDEVAVKLREVYLNWDDTYNLIASGTAAPREAIENIAEQTARTMAEVRGESAAVAEYYKQKLMKNIYELVENE